MKIQIFEKILVQDINDKVPKVQNLNLYFHNIYSRVARFYTHP